MLYILVLALGFILFSLLGYWTHLSFHRPWTGRFYRSHQTHHFKLYPPSDFISETYRNPGKDNSVWLFAIAFSPLILTAILITVFGIIPLGIGLTILGQMGLISWVNGSMHDSFHLTNSFWHRFWFFKRLQALHHRHHVSVKHNYGIYSFFWDRVFGSFWDTDNNQHL